MKISNLGQINKDSISNIIFDWGGVITELDFEATARMFQDLGLENFGQYFSKSHQTEFLTDFETGKIIPEEFRNTISKYLSPGTTIREIDAAWNSVIGETPAERIDLLKRLGKKYNLYLLSNTNKIHTDTHNQNLRDTFGTDHHSLFKKVYYSNITGMRKPDVRFFRHVLADSNLEPERTLYIDDTEIHIHAASETGINAFHLDSGMDIISLFKNW
ncbi:MAG: HAD family phosphatase [Bacteroidales bacterium]|jgi:putative hydrolase of the HAD superfamily